METNIKSISQMIGDELYDQILDLRPKLKEKDENLIKQAISTAYATGLSDAK